MHMVKAFSRDSKSHSDDGRNASHQFYMFPDEKMSLKVKSEALESFFATNVFARVPTKKSFNFYFKIELIRIKRMKDEGKNNSKVRGKKYDTIGVFDQLVDFNLKQFLSTLQYADGVISRRYMGQRKNSLKVKDLHKIFGRMRKAKLENTRRSTVEVDIEERKDAYDQAIICQLPTEILIEIFTFIEFEQDLGKIFLACKEFYLIFENEIFWRLYCKLNFNTLNHPLPVYYSEVGSWRKVFEIYLRTNIYVYITPVVDYTAGYFSLSASGHAESNKMKHPIFASHGGGDGEFTFSARDMEKVKMVLLYGVKLRETSSSSSSVLDNKCYDVSIFGKSYNIVHGDCLYGLLGALCYHYSLTRNRKNVPGVALFLFIVRVELKDDNEEKKKGGGGKKYQLSVESIDYPILSVTVKPSQKKSKKKKKIGSTTTLPIRPPTTRKAMKKKKKKSVVVGKSVYFRMKSVKFTRSEAKKIVKFPVVKTKKGKKMIEMDFSISVLIGEECMRRRWGNITLGLEKNSTKKVLFGSATLSRAVSIFDF